MKMDALLSASRIAQSGMSVQSERLRVIAENLANANSTGRSSGSDPYARKVISFRAELEEQGGESGIALTDVGRDNSPFRVVHEPGHPAADENGYVKYPNVDPLIELADLREANRSYMANLQMIKNAREAVSALIDLLRTPS
ncbi:MAG: flagellar basal body rod protein FlgC [Hyphomicrobium sp.]|nr:flagellar basal body rod protein FlgC [Hyphomicrobium sp.]